MGHVSHCFTQDFMRYLMISAGHAAMLGLKMSLRFGSGSAGAKAHMETGQKSSQRNRKRSNQRFGTVNQSLQDNSLVGGLEHGFYAFVFHFIDGMSSFPLTHIFQRGWNHQPILILKSFQETAFNRPERVYPRSFQDLEKVPHISLRTPTCKPRSRYKFLEPSDGDWCPCDNAKHLSWPCGLELKVEQLMNVDEVHGQKNDYYKYILYIINICIYI